MSAINGTFFIIRYCPKSHPLGSLISQNTFQIFILMHYRSTSLCWSDRTEYLWEFLFHHVEVFNRIRRTLVLQKPLTQPPFGIFLYLAGGEAFFYKCLQTRQKIIEISHPKKKCLAVFEMVLPEASSSFVRLFLHQRKQPKSLNTVCEILWI